jgi:hypothetical protein
MIKIISKNGTYFGLTKEELKWLSQNEKSLPQMKNDKKVIFLTPKEMKKLFEK